MKALKIIIPILFLLLAAIPLFAQAPPPPGSQNGAPIDSAILILSGAGVLYGSYRKMKSSQ
jgi:hypothetical protein